MPGCVQVANAISAKIVIDFFQAAIKVVVFVRFHVTFIMACLVSNAVKVAKNRAMPLLVKITNAIRAERVINEGQAAISFVKAMPFHITQVFTESISNMLFSTFSRSPRAISVAKTMPAPKVDNGLGTAIATVVIIVEIVALVIALSVSNQSRQARISVQVSEFVQVANAGGACARIDLIKATIKGVIVEWITLDIARVVTSSITNKFGHANTLTPKLIDESMR